MCFSIDEKDSLGDIVNNQSGSDEMNKKIKKKKKSEKKKVSNKLKKVF